MILVVFEDCTRLSVAGLCRVWYSVWVHALKTHVDLLEILRTIVWNETFASVKLKAYKWFYIGVLQWGKGGNSDHFHAIAVSCVIGHSLVMASAIKNQMQSACLLHRRQLPKINIKITTFKTIFWLFTAQTASATPHDVRHKRVGYARKSPVLWEEEQEGKVHCISPKALPHASIPSFHPPSVFASCCPIEHQRTQSWPSVCTLGIWTV